MNRNMNRKKRSPVAYVTEGLGPRRNEITRWYYRKADRGNRQWVVIVSLRPDNENEILYEDGPVDGGHWGHDGGGSIGSPESFLINGGAPKWTHATPKDNRIIKNFLAALPPTLEKKITDYLALPVNRERYPNWFFFDEPSSFSIFGKFGDEYCFCASCLGGSKKDSRKIMFEDNSHPKRRIIIGRPYSDEVLAAFHSIEEMQNYLADDKADAP